MKGTVLGAIIIPVVQRVIREIVAATPVTGQSEPTIGLIFVSVRLLPLLPVVGTLAGGVTSYFFVGFVITTIAYIFRSKQSRQQYSRPPRF